MVDPQWQVMVQDMDTKGITVYALSRDNWAHRWAATTRSGSVVMWVPEGLMDDKTTAVITSGRKWTKIRVVNVSPLSAEDIDGIPSITNN
jgi:hypothetical protein